MGDYILVIDGAKTITPHLEDIFIGTSIRAVNAKDVLSAKRKLIQKAPELILVNGISDADPEAPYRFCNELRSHPTLSEISVLVFVKENLVVEDTYSKAEASGANGVLPVPTTRVELREVIQTLLPELIEQTDIAEDIEIIKGEREDFSSDLGRTEEDVEFEIPLLAEPEIMVKEKEVDEKEAIVDAPRLKTKDEDTSKTILDSSPSLTVPSETKVDALDAVDFEGGAATEQIVDPLSGADLDDPESLEKIAKAEELLAQVLANLKTSDLFHVVDVEDIPRIVSELAKTVCQEANQQPAAEKAEKAEGSVDTPRGLTALSGELEDVFGLKK